MLETSRLYDICKAKDARFDGRFFLAVSSTRIYCRPICRAKMPKRENCSFYETAAEAEQAGYRPCLLCRPELAPGTAANSLARRAAKMMEENSADGQSMADIAARLRCTDRHLRRSFRAEYHVSPAQYLQTARLLLAKSLLTDTKISVLDVAMASGYGSLRRFNAAFKGHYRLSPSALRKEAAQDTASGALTLALGYRPPYRFEAMLRFFENRAIPGVEMVRENAYWRTVFLPPAHGFLKVEHEPKRNVLLVTVSEGLLPVLPKVLSKIKNLFDLYCDPATVYEGLQGMNGIRPNLCVLGTRLPGCFDSFEMAVRAILGQQITVKAARTLAARLVNAYGEKIETGIAGLSHAFPTVRDILSLTEPIENHLGPLGIIAARARTIKSLAEEIENGGINLGHCTHPEEEMKKLKEIRGIGDWTAKYIAMRTMGWTDAFLETDAGVKKALAPHTEKEMLQMAEEWHPWCSNATMNLWNSL